MSDKIGPIEEKDHISPPQKQTDKNDNKTKQPERSILRDTWASLKMNYKSWIVVIVCVYLISGDNYVRGYITFIFMILLAYFVHRISHEKRNILSICHHYHHEHTNLFSHFIQIVLELLSACINYFPQFVYPLVFFDNWIILFFYFFYTTLHNVNYSILHVNQIHEFHHININTNIGPDICDILFQTKKDAPPNHYLENTDHYIPNILFGLGMVYVLRHFYSQEEWRPFMDRSLHIIVASSIIVLIVSSVYLVHVDKKGAVYNPYYTYQDILHFLGK